MTDSDAERAKELLKQFEDAMSGMGFDNLPPPAAGPSRRRPRRKQPVTFRIKVDLEDASPPIWRRLDVRSDIGLETLHHILQAAFAWTDSHLHRFALGDSVFDRNAEMFLCPYDAEEGDEEGVPASEVQLDETLAESGDVLRYCYDYGDSWDLDIVLESVRPPDPARPAAVCIDGQRAAPPEDCGGLRTEDLLAEVLDDPARFDLDEVNQALTDPFVELHDSGANPELVDLLTRLRGTDLGNELVARVVSLAHLTSPRTSDEERATALQPILWFLDHVGDDGLTLTSAGYLKPVDVIAAAPMVPDMADWLGSYNREVHTVPVLQFRQALTSLGLLRKYRGRLLLTKTGAKVRGAPHALWAHLADRLPLGRIGSAERCAGQLALVWAASSPGEPVPMDGLADALNALGWRQGQAPIDDYLAQWTAADTLGVLDNVTAEPRTRGFLSRRTSSVAADLARDAVVTHPGGR